jgi:hypothetical protein
MSRDLSKQKQRLKQAWAIYIGLLREVMGVNIQTDNNNILTLR